MLSLYSEVRRTIEWCVEHGLQLSICSKSSNYDGAKLILTSLGLWEHFEFPQIYYSRKTFHFRNLRGCTNYSYSDFLFFDDDSKNIDVCRSIGVSGCLVDKAIGFNGYTLLSGLQRYAARQNIPPPSPWDIIKHKKRRANSENHEENESKFSFQWTAQT